MSDPAYLHTVSMSELYETVYQSRPPVIDGLLYFGTYLFAGAPKVGKSFLMAQLAYHVSTGLSLWGYTVHKGTVLYLALEDDHRRCRGGCTGCLAWTAPTISALRFTPNSSALVWRNS